MAWRAVFDAQWGRDPVDVTGTWEETRRVLAAQIAEGLDILGCDCRACRADGEQALRQLAAGQGSEVEAEIDGELYRISRA